jgi:hypothetical protein
LIDCLRARGYNNIYIIDNASDYKPLLSYYSDAKLRVFRLPKNVGCYAMWQTDIGKSFEKTYYALTDPDVLPIEECPNDFVELFITTLGKHSQVGKVGFGLRLDDLPTSSTLWHSIVSHELHFWRQRIAPNLYLAPICVVSGQKSQPR